MALDELFLCVIDGVLGGAEPDMAPGFAVNDFAQLGRMLFWPSLLSIALGCAAWLQGVAAS